VARQSEVRPLCERDPALTRPDGTPIRILAVDDESSLTELLSMAMRYEGWQVTTAASGGQAVKVARETRPDAIVLDMMLPGRSGFLVLEKIKAKKPRNAKPFVIMITGNIVVSSRSRIARHTAYPSGCGITTYAG
jgi:two-component system OmpR family response regulator